MWWQSINTQNELEEERIEEKEGAQKWNTGTFYNQGKMIGVLYKIVLWLGDRYV